MPMYPEENNSCRLPKSPGFINLQITAILLLIAYSLSSCNGSRTELVKQRTADSINTQRQAWEDKSIDSLSKNLNAIRFSKLGHLKFSIDFDTLINKTVLLEDFTLVDIQRVDEQYIAKVAMDNFHYLVDLRIQKEDIAELRQGENDDSDSYHLLLVDFSDVSITDVDLEGEFYRQKANNFCEATGEEMPFTFVFKISASLSRIIKR